jgi:hypothetical protein
VFVNYSLLIQIQQQGKNGESTESILMLLEILLTCSTYEVNAEKMNYTRVVQKKVNGPQ